MLPERARAKERAFQDRARQYLLAPRPIQVSAGASNPRIQHVVESMAGPISGSSSRRSLLRRALARRASAGAFGWVRETAETSRCRPNECSRDGSTDRDRFAAVLRHANVYLFGQDRELRYTSISNPLFGRDVEQIIGRTDDDILPEPSRAAVVALKRSA